MAAQSKQPLCLVTIGYMRLLLPQAQAIKLYEVASKAVGVEYDYGAAGVKYTVTGPVEIEMTTVRPGQIVMPEASMAPARPARQKPLRLT